MKILGIDTSSKVLSIALGGREGVIIEESHLVDRKHSCVIIPKIKEMLEKIKLSIDDVDAFIVGLGPGSFTGLRIGVSTVKGFGIATRKPCIGVPSIDAIALNVDDKGIGTIVPIIDAKRGKVYSAIYRRTRNKIVRKSNHLLLSVNDLVRRINGPAVFLGDGIGLYREEIQRLNKKAVFLEEKYWYPKASNLIKLALGKVKKAKKPDLSKLKPIYLYPKDCQVRENCKV